MVIESKINSFIGDLKLGVSFWQSAGEKLVRMLDEDPRVFGQILDSKECPWVTMDILLTMEAIGRKQIAPEALLLPKHVLERIAALPMGEQLKIISEPIPVVMGRSTGRHQTDLKSARSLNRAEAARVIGKDGIRTPEEQEKLLQVAPTASIGVYELAVMNGKVFVKKMPLGARATNRVLLTNGKALIELVQ